MEVIDITRSTLPKEKPVFVRISATDNSPDGEKNEHGEYISWGLEQAKVYLAEAIKRGVALLDASSSGNDPKQKIKLGPGYQVRWFLSPPHEEAQADLLLCRCRSPRNFGLPLPTRTESPSRPSDSSPTASRPRRSCKRAKPTSYVLSGFPLELCADLSFLVRRSPSLASSFATPI